MASPIINAIGWTELMDGKLIGAAFAMYDGAFLGWFVPLLFVVYQAILLIKTKNLTLAWVTGIFFISMYATSMFVKAQASLPIIFIILVFELAGIFYFLIWK